MTIELKTEVEQLIAAEARAKGIRPAEQAALLLEQSVQVSQQSKALAYLNSLRSIDSAEVGEPWEAIQERIDRRELSFHDSSSLDPLAGTD